MKSKVSRIFGLMVVVLVIVCVCACAPGAKPPAEKGVVKVKVGAILDLSGPTASSTLPGVYGLRDVVAYITKQGGKDWKGGKVIVEIEEYDNRYDPSLSLAAWERWRAQGIPLIITHQSSDNMQFKERAAVDKIPILTLSPTSGALVPPGWVFANYLSYADSFAGFMEWVAKTWDWKGKGAPRIASLTWDTAYGKAHLCALAHAQKLGIEYVGTEYTAIMPADVTPQVTRLKELKANYVWTQAVQPLGVYMRDFKRLGFGGRLVAGLNSGIIEYIPVAGVEAAVGTLAVRGIATPGAGTRFDDTVKTITAALGVTRDPATFYSNGVSAGCILYDVIARALNKAGDPGKLSGQMVYEALVETRNVDTMGATAPASFSETQRRATLDMEIVEVQTDGKIKVIQNWFKAPDALVLYPECAK